MKTKEIRKIFEENPSRIFTTGEISKRVNLNIKDTCSYLSMMAKNHEIQRVGKGKYVAVVDIDPLKIIPQIENFEIYISAYENILWKLKKDKERMEVLNGEPDLKTESKIAWFEEEIVKYEDHLKHKMEFFDLMRAWDMPESFKLNGNTNAGKKIKIRMRDKK